jgi:hypothetical protein
MNTLIDSIKINFYNIYKLFTKEDGNYFHIHKILGSISLLNYSYRFYLWYNYNTMFIVPNFSNIILIFSHALLSASSFFFKLSSKRIRVTPIIWPEGRLHSIIFGYRSIFIIFIFFIYWKTHYEVLNYVRGIIVILTIKCADYVTNYYKLELKILEENDSTMRKMPISSNISEKIINNLNIFYSISQIFATMNCIFAKNIERVFLVLFPIQIAMFLMTLAKKNIISSSGWHLWYSISLLINYFFQLYSKKYYFDIIEKIIYFSLGISFTIMRLKYNYNKYYLWYFIILVHWISLFFYKFKIPYEP